GRLANSAPPQTRDADAFELAGAFELRQEAAQVGVAPRRAYLFSDISRSQTASEKSSRVELRPRTGYSRCEPARSITSVVLPIQPNTPSAMPPSAMSAPRNGSALPTAPRKPKVPCNTRVTAFGSAAFAISAA